MQNQPKSTWLQIRVSPADKARLRAAAEAAGADLSAYVLERAMPRKEEAEYERLVEGMLHPLERTPHFYHAEFTDYLLTLPRARAHEIANPPKAFPRLSLRDQNYVAAHVEERAAFWGIEPPRWVLDVPPLPEPDFGDSTLLIPYYLRMAKVIYRRRNQFLGEHGLRGRLATLADGEGFDGVGLIAPLEPRMPRPSRVAERRPAWGGQSDLRADDILRLFRALEAELATKQVGADLHVVGGAVMTVVFGAREATRDVDAMFAPPEVVREAVMRVAEQEGVAPDWLNDAVKGFLSHQGDFEPYLELPFLRVFVASPEYLLAMKCLALRPREDGFSDRDDIRFLLRYLGISNVEVALDIVERYYPASRLSVRVHLALQELLAEVLGA